MPANWTKNLCENGVGSPENKDSRPRFRTGSNPAQAAAKGLGVLALLAAGCSGPKLDFAEVEGKVLLNEKPLGGVMVRFYPSTDGLEQLPYASGISDAFGHYRLSRQDGQPGALVGPNRVVVYWPSRDLREAALKGGSPLPPAEPPIPLKYTVAADTPLHVVVRPGPRQNADLRLEGEAEPAKTDPKAVKK